MTSNSRPGPVQGKDIEDQAHAKAETAGRMAGMLAMFPQAPPGPQKRMDAIAVFRRLGQTAEALTAAAGVLR